jgi:CheY-like chemotaxis protein
MPFIGGIELASRLRTRMPSLAVVYMTGYPEDEAISRGVESGAARLVRKPFDRATLTRALHEALRARDD